MVDAVASGIVALTPAADAAADAAASDAASECAKIALEPSDQFCSSEHIEHFSARIAEKFGLEENLMPRTVFIGLDTGFAPLRVFPFLEVARSAVFGMGKMLVASCATAVGNTQIAYHVGGEKIDSASGLVEMWTIRVDATGVIGRFLIAPTDRLGDDLVSDRVPTTVYTVKTKD